MRRAGEEESELDWGEQTPSELERAMRLLERRLEASLRQQTPSELERAMRRRVNRMPATSKALRLDLDPYVEIPIDIIDKEHELILLADLPGLKAGAIEITVQGDTVSILGERRPSIQLYPTHERWEGQVHRNIPLPSSVEAENVRAKFQNGVLEIHLPKSTRPVKKVQIQDATSEPAFEFGPSEEVFAEKKAGHGGMIAVEKDDVWPQDKEFPNAFYADELKGVKRRNYLVVIKLNDQSIQRIIESPRTDQIKFKDLQEALGNALSQLRETYPANLYDIVIGQGNLRVLKNALPTISGWESARTEKLAV